MNRRVITAVSAITMGAVGTFGLVGYVRGVEQEARAGDEVAEVYVVSSPIARGASGEELEGKVQTAEIPKRFLTESSVVDLEDLEGKVATVDLVPGEPLLATRFAVERDFARRTPVEPPDRLLQVTISLQPERALGGKLRAGDTVGLIASFDPFDVEALMPDGKPVDGVPKQTPNTTHLILHKVLVTNVQAGGTVPEAQPEDPDHVETAPGGNIYVTLALDAPSIERVVFASEFGRVWLSAEPQDAYEEGTQVQTRGTVYEEAS